MAEAFDEQRQQRTQQEGQTAVQQSSPPVSSYRKVRVPGVVLRQPAYFFAGHPYRCPFLVGHALTCSRSDIP